MIDYLIGVDGGGSGTRVRLTRADGSALAQGQGGPSGLALGIDAAWAAVTAAAQHAFGAAGLAMPPPGRSAIGLGMAGVHNKRWAQDFLARQPGYAALALATDGQTTVLGAHGGRPGLIVALGTGSVGEGLYADGSRHEVSGWGFPAGDEAGGAWIGLRAVAHMQHVVDGRASSTPFGAALAAACGGCRDAIQDWLAGARQTDYARLARIVLEHAGSDPAARAMLDAAGEQAALIAAALDRADPAPDRQGAGLPIALCGGLAAPLRPYLPAWLLRRVVPAAGDSAAGALLLIGRRLQQRTPSERTPC